MTYKTSSNHNINIQDSQYLLMDKCHNRIISQFWQLLHNIDSIVENLEPIEGIADNIVSAKTIWLRMNDIFKFTTREIYGFAPSCELYEDISSFGTGEPIMEHSFNDSLLLFYTNRIVSIRNGVLDRVDVEPGLRINLN